MRRGEKMKVSIVGATGYSGLELFRLLSTHREVEIAGLYSQSFKGENIRELYPYMQKIYNEDLRGFHAEKIMATSDCVFLATPSGVSKEIANPFIQANFPVIDLSGDFRLKNAQTYEKWYQKSAPKSEWLQQSTYGLADLSPHYGSNLIANPGCYATATLLGLAPLIQSDWVQVDSVIVDAKSGLSGAGKMNTKATHYVEANENMSVYKVNQHQHIPEVMQQLKIWNKKMQPIQFSTSLIPVTRGIMATIYAKPNKKITQQELFELYEFYYEKMAFIRIQPQNCFPDLRQVVGSNFCDIGLTYNEKTGMIMIVSVIDNLLKGAAGQAVQNMNLFYQFNQNEGLRLSPVYL